MFFKNAIFYEFTDELPYIPELAEALETRQARDCTGLELVTRGFVPPAQHDIVIQVKHIDLICLQTCERILPTAVVRKFVDDKVSEIEEAEGRAVGRKERSRIRDEVVVDLIPRAFMRYKRMYAYIDRSRKILVVEASSSTAADNLVSRLRDALGSLKVRPISAQLDVPRRMAGWIEKRNGIPDSFMLLDEAVLEDGDGGKTTIKGRDLFVEPGETAEKIRVSLKDSLDVTLTHDLRANRIVPYDEITFRMTDEEADDPVSRMMADTIIMSEEIGKLYQALKDAELAA